MTKRLLLLVLVGALALPLAGCQTGRGSHRPDPNTLYVGAVQSSFPSAYMPWLSREGIAPTIANMLYSSLFSYDEETDRYLPSIGREWYYVDENGEPILTEDGSIDYARLEEIYSDPQYDYLAVKVIIHQDITWSDGVPLTVEDIYYSFDLATNHALSNHAGALAWTSDLKHKYNNGVLVEKGLFTYERGALEQGYHIDPAEKDYVIYLHVNKVLGAVTPLFTSVLILPKHVWEPVVSRENQLNSSSPSAELLYRYTHPVGCGPWVLDTEQSGSQQIVLHRRQDYHLKKPDGSPLYGVDTIKFILYKEQNVALYALLKGHIDVLDSSVSSNYLLLFAKEKDLFVSNAPGTFTQTLVFNLNPVASERNPLRDLLANREFRKALALAVNQDELIKNVLDGAGVPASAGLMRPSLTDFYNPEADSIVPRDYAQRLALANEILDGIVPDKDKDGYRLLGGERISFKILGTPGEQDVVSFLQIQFKKIGIDVQYAPKGAQPESTYLYTSKFDLVLQGVIFSLSNVDIMYPAHFSTLGRTSNYGRLVNEGLNAAIEEMRYTLNLNRKYELLKELQPMIAQEFYKVPLYTANVISVARTDRFTGFQVVEGSTVFNSESLQNLRRVEGR
ncbi:MAG: ABC transporter substrate-binding protein [Limnochordia bacterium]|nr:ABC transporter substrate-binding protein [Limnochordia bacterium]HOQ73946.1 ABC transporter substrate-binding protein [Limnochordia bacterium]HPZ79648.1 ABC transporter substrate-binding protein [Limnochordia bacterium]